MTSTPHVSFRLSSESNGQACRNSAFFGMRPNVGHCSYRRKSAETIFSTPLLCIWVHTCVRVDATHRMSKRDDSLIELIRWMTQTQTLGTDRILIAHVSQNSMHEEKVTSALTRHSEKLMNSGVDSAKTCLSRFEKPRIFGVLY